MSSLLFKVNPDLDPIPSYFLKDLALLVILTQLFSDYFSLKKILQHSCWLLAVSLPSFSIQIS